MLRNDRMKRIVVSWVFFTLMGLALTGCMQKSQEMATSEPSLYERVGGINNIAVLIDDVIERSYVHPVFVNHPEIHAAHLKFPKAVYKFNATCLASMAMGGPHKYYGRSIADAHQHLDINEKEWNALIQIFNDSMDAFKVPDRERAEVIAILESSKSDVIAKKYQKK